MKQINFNAKEVLQSLLDRTKVQTIRKAWKDLRSRNWPDKTIDKPPKYKVGETVEIVWKGETIIDFIGGNIYSGTVLGKVKITEVFEIEMKKDTDRIYQINLGRNSLQWWTYNLDGCYEGNDSHVPHIVDLAKRDGFKSPEEMFKYFDKNYDLSSPKKFYVYRGVKQ